MGSPKHYPTYRPAQTAALAKSLSVSTVSTILAKASGRIDEAAASDDYFIQFLCNTTTLPADGASITHLIPPIKIKHTTGSDSYFDVDLSPNYMKAKKGLFIVASTTEFTKTIVGSDIMSCVALKV